MNALERITAILERARIDGGWDDEDVAADVLKALRLDDDGYPVAPAPSGTVIEGEPPTPIGPDTA